ncbi:MAG: class I SAM-dependent rRNA methyltransferase [Saprospiraceae bacterium]|nr:class I SAM-dependent rRNA methyltransferase [Saprospiraceae bacterium]
MSSFVVLKKGKEFSVLRKHPWVFSGAVLKTSPSLSQGQVVEVQQYDGTYLGKGHYQHGGSIVVRMLSLLHEDIDQDFWNQVLLKAFLYRKSLGLTDNRLTNAYRLIHGEGDGLPGLVIDVYGDIFVIQCHSIGMYLQKNEIGNAIKFVYARENISVYCRAKDTLPDFFSQNIEDTFLTGNAEETTILENGQKFHVNIIEGQKTGFFLDQRENRLLLQSLAKNKSVLNTFCYTGGFSVYALTGGAQKVDSVDISGKAMDLTDVNISLNNFGNHHRSFTENVIPYLNQVETDSYDIVVVDPPAFAKSLAKRHNAVQAYKRLNISALKKVNPGGYLFTFSCSQVVNTQLFYDTIVAAGIESNRNIRVVRHLSQASDHPVSLFHPEGHYLKGLLLYVE